MIDHPGDARSVHQDAIVPVQRHTADPGRGPRQVRFPDDWQVVRAEGELDVESVPRLRSLLETAGPFVLLDLSCVTFMDASGLGVLAAASERARSRGGAVRLVGPCREVRRIVTVTRLDGVLSMFDTMGEALASDPA